MSSSSNRYFNNKYPDYDNQRNNRQKFFYVHEGLVSINPRFSTQIFSFNTQLAGVLIKKFEDYSGGDYSVYTGLSGIVFLCLRLLEDPFLMKTVPEDIEEKLLLPCLEATAHNKEISFHCGKSGPLTIGALYHHFKKDDAKRDMYVRSILNLFQSIESKPDELLYGKSGYLYCLLLLKKKIKTSDLDSTILTTVNLIIESGVGYSNSQNSQSPLMYQWHGTEYLGAAHGLGGILHLLLEAHEFLSKENLLLVQNSLNWLMDLQFDDGNFPAAVGGRLKDLVHWCHGCPGLIPLLVKAYNIFKEEKYLISACKAGDLVWKKGLLSKGYGLCHGVAGNGYGFLHLYQATNDPKHFYRACCFAEWCRDYGKHKCKTPDSPYSLMEGIGGMVYFLADILVPKEAKFPTFAI